MQKREKLNPEQRDRIDRLRGEKFAPEPIAPTAVIEPAQKTLFDLPA